jgi:D-sedoheptulose 7-phosphate isomerase
MRMSHSRRYLDQVAKIANEIDHEVLERIAVGLVNLRKCGGRLFILGVGGSAANASHMVNDFRKIARIEAYAPTDNVSELTARTNDEGWDTVFSEWLKVSRAGEGDAVFVLSVGGGDVDRNVSVNIVQALEEAQRRRLRIYGIVGRSDGHTARVADEVVIVPTVDPAHVTAHAESFQAVVWHCIVFHPELIATTAKWEGLQRSEESR